MPAGTVTNYVMNEAAVTSEAFSNVTNFDAFDPLLVSHAHDWGYSPFSVDIDLRFDNEWATMFNQRTPADPASCNRVGTPDACKSYYDIWKDTVGSDLSDEELRIRYAYRWRQQRAPWNPEAVPTGTLPSRGPWRGFFADNAARTHIINTYNTTDYVLGTAWWTMQQAQKPNVGPLGLGSDSISRQFWGKMDNTGVDEQFPWQPNDDLPINNDAHANVVRQWAELAHWFPSMTLPAGYGVLSSDVDTIQNIDFTPFGGPGGPANTLISHSYMTGKDFFEVWGAYVAIHDALPAQP
jgi:hypothetical protein